MPNTKDALRQLVYKGIMQCLEYMRSYEQTDEDGGVCLQCKEYIERSYKNPQLSVEMIGNVLGMYRNLP